MIVFWRRYVDLRLCDATIRRLSDATIHHLLVVLVIAPSIKTPETCRVGTRASGAVLAYTEASSILVQYVILASGVTYPRQSRTLLHTVRHRASLGIRKWTSQVEPAILLTIGTKGCSGKHEVEPLPSRSVQRLLASDALPRSRQSHIHPASTK